jgi:hypothetical protein
MMNRTLIILLGFLAMILLAGCNLVAQTTPQGEPPISTPGTTPETTATDGQGSPTLPTTTVKPTTAPLPAHLIAWYPLTSDLNDLTGKNGAATASIGSPSPDGLYCNASCDAATPYLSGLNFNAFTIRVEFLEPQYPVFRDSVFVGGEYRWVKYKLMPDGSIFLVYNNDKEVPCSVKYQLNVWHEAVISYDGATLKLYLDGTEGCRVTTALDTGGVNFINFHDSGVDSSFIGVVKNLQVFDSAEIPQARVPQPGNVPSDVALAPVDAILSSCPTAAELAAIDADLALTFESDPSSGTLVCNASAGSRDLTSFKRIVYTTLLVMKKLEFTQPLPWTDKQLYTWLVDTIKGIRFRNDIEYSSCCEPANVINIQNGGNLSVKSTNRWIDPQINTGAMDLLALFVHEARHNEIGGHKCGTNDNTRAEMGAWGVQYYLFTYLANNLKDPSFLTMPDSGLSTYYSKIEASDANLTLSTRFCSDK